MNDLKLILSTEYTRNKVKDVHKILLKANESDLTARMYRRLTWSEQQTLEKYIKSKN